MTLIGLIWIRLPETLKDLLCEVGSLFVPFMLKTANAVASGDKMLECELGRKTLGARSLRLPGQMSYVAETALR
jgi:hypothetical protein